MFKDSWFQLEGGKWSLTRHPFESMIHAVSATRVIDCTDGDVDVFSALIWLAHSECL
jgi:hypothetical protein